MSNWTLKETTIPVRGKDVKIRELTHKERTAYIKEGGADKFRLPAMMASLGSLDPKMTEADWTEEPADIIDIVSQAVGELSGLVGKVTTSKKAQAVIQQALDKLAKLDSSKELDEIAALLTSLTKKDDVQKESDAGSAVSV